MFEKSVRLDPSNKEAAGDLLDFYLDAPGFLGGGWIKPRRWPARSANPIRPRSITHMAVIDDQRKEYDAARSSSCGAPMELAPRQVWRFVCAGEISGAPRQAQGKRRDVRRRRRGWRPKPSSLLRARADLHSEQRRNLGQARELLEQISALAADPRRSAAGAGRSAA